MSTETTGGSAAASPSIQEQAQEILMPLAAGFVGHRTVTLGLRRGFFEKLVSEPDGMTAEELAGSSTSTRSMWSVWCRAALSAGLVEEDRGRYRAGRAHG